MSQLPRDTVSRAMNPLPPECLGVMTSAHQRFSPHTRTSVAQRALEEVHGIAASEEDISFVFEKLEAGKPELLRGVPAGIVEPPVLWPCSASCNRCKQPLGAHRRPVKVTFLSSDSGKGRRHGDAVRRLRLVFSRPLVLHASRSAMWASDLRPLTAGRA